MGDLGIDGEIFKGDRLWGCDQGSYGPAMGPCEHGNGPMGSMNGWKFLGCVRDCQLLK